MQIKHVETLISTGSFAGSKRWLGVRKKLHEAIRHVHWPAGADEFTIYPESGKQRGQGNGVKPIKQGLMVQLEKEGWEVEQTLEWKTRPRPGKFDAVLWKPGLVAVEWETGNISSSHRALNKMCLALLKGLLKAGTLIVPTRELYRYLTDRVGNWNELIPYLDLWKSIQVAEGVLEIVAIEHDATSWDVPRIGKGTNGRALA